MSQSLHLTKVEKRLFSLLSPELQKAWKKHLVDETSDAYETDEQIKERFTALGNDVKFSHELSKALERCGNDMSLVFNELPDHAIPTFLQGIGACGICAMVEGALKSGAVNDELLSGIANLTAIRHDILRDNQKVAA